MVHMKIKSLFFDRAAVISAVDRATRKVLSKFGAFVRTGARHSIRKRKAISAPGSPPSSHEGSLKRLIYFAYEPAQRSVVIGPVPFKEGQAPALLEYGGPRKFKDARSKRRRAFYRARPFMGPAFDREKPKLPAMWAGSVRR